MVGRRAAGVGVRAGVSVGGAGSCGLLGGAHGGEREEIRKGREEKGDREREEKGDREEPGRGDRERGRRWEIERNQGGEGRRWEIEGMGRENIGRKEEIREDRF